MKNIFGQIALAASYSFFLSLRLDPFLMVDMILNKPVVFLLLVSYTWWQMEKINYWEDLQ